MMKLIEATIQILHIPNGQGLTINVTGWLLVTEPYRTALCMWTVTGQF